MICYKLSNSSDIGHWIDTIGSTKEGRVIMAKKGKMNLFCLKNLKTPAVNILKQDALSIGADVATPKGVITCEHEFSNALLMATNAQLGLLVKKLKAQPFGLKTLAKKLEKFLHVKKFKPKIMGVLNVNEDSFFHGSRFVGKEALGRVEKMIEDGADIVDVGGVSSRPGSEYVGEEEELRRVKPIIDKIYQNNLHEKAIFSLDSYSPKSLEYALDRGFSFVNDITALENEKVAKITAKYQATICLMHMQNDPKTMQQEPYYEDVMSDIDKIFAQKIELANSFGIKDIVLDVGIGFGKSLEHNLTLIKHQSHFLHFGHELLVGASRKSMIDKVIKTPVEQRLPGTLAIHLEALRNGASIIRCHDVKEHKQAMCLWEAMSETL